MDDRQSPAAGRLEPYLHLFVLWTLVGAHPLLELLARQPEFFAVRDWDAGEILALAVIVTFAAPLPLAGLRFAASRLGERAARWGDRAIVGAAVALFVLQLSIRTIAELVGGLPVLALAAAAGAAAAAGYGALSAVRLLVTFLSPALVVVPLMFFLDARPRSAEGPASELADLEISPRPPIFLIVFDSLSVTALMDREQRVNAFRYPHLAALAADASWYTSASTVGRWTVEALPTILTGNFPDPEKLPRLADHPRNLFTLLGGSYRTVASESTLKLCPASLNAFPQPAPPPALRSIASDLALVYLHRTLPRELARRLPPVDQGWGNFARAGEALKGEVERFYQFLETLDGDADATLHFLHTVFPHMPYQYLPSGKIFRRQVSSFVRPMSRAERRNPDLETQILVMKRYLFQAGMVDRMVGDLVARLEELDLYDRSLIVLTADHGSRTAPPGFPEDIFFVPLLVKRPHQAAGEIVRTPVSHVDLLPTLLDLLGTESPWPMDGRSFLAPGIRSADQFEVYVQKRRRPFDLALHGRKQALIDWKLEHLGSGEDPRSIYRAGGPHPELLDLTLGELVRRPQPGLRVELDLGSSEVEVDPAADFAPSLISGSLFVDSYDADCCRVAVTVNGVVQATATAQPYQPPRWRRFRAFVPESAFRPGRNRVQVWVVSPQLPGVLLQPSTSARSISSSSATESPAAEEPRQDARLRGG